MRDLKTAKFRFLLKIHYLVQAEASPQISQTQSDRRGDTLPEWTINPIVIEISNVFCVLQDGQKAALLVARREQNFLGRRWGRIRQLPQFSQI